MIRIPFFKQPHRFWICCLLSMAALPTASFKVGHAADEVVNIYSYRQPFLVQPMLDVFTRETGIETNVLFAKKGLVERLRQEGKNSPADVILTVDISRLEALRKAGLVQSVKSQKLQGRIPEQYIGTHNTYFGLTTRVRAIYASRDRVKPREIVTYEQLADPKWKGRICTRSGKHVYQLGLLSSLINHMGKATAETWLAGVKSNLARKPQGNDRAQVKAIKEGQCDLSLGNSYYLGKMLQDEEQFTWAQSVNIVFPNQNDRGASVNVSGMAMAKHAPNRAHAVKLMEFMASDLAQRMYAENNFEYPVVDGIAWPSLLESWGRFKSDVLPMKKLAEGIPEATRMVDRVGYDQ